jgi:alpha-L-fucosidase
LGTIECDLVEATPVVFKRQLYRFEYVRARYYRKNKLGRPYFRFIHVATGRPTPPFAIGYELGSAYAEADTMYAYGVKGWGTDTVYVFWSKDLQHWSSAVALKLPGWAIYNTSVCKGKGRYVMAFEVGKPAEVAGRPFTNRFAVSDDLVHWQLLPEPHVFTKERYSACPSIRYLDGYFYMFYLEARPGPTYETHLVRSTDLVHWESSPLNPVLRHGPEDRRVANPQLSPAERKRIASATNINNSDFDLCEYNGRVVIYYSWGNQRGVEHLAEASYNGTLAQFLKGFFPRQ